MPSCVHHVLAQPRVVVGDRLGVAVLDEEGIGQQRPVKAVGRNGTVLPVPERASIARGQPVIRPALAVCPERRKIDMVFLQGLVALERRGRRVLATMGPSRRAGWATRRIPRGSSMNRIPASSGPAEAFQVMAGSPFPSGSSHSNDPCRTKYQLVKTIRRPSRSYGSPGSSTRTSSSIPFSRTVVITVLRSFPASRHTRVMEREGAPPARRKPGPRPLRSAGHRPLQGPPGKLVRPLFRGQFVLVYDLMGPRVPVPFPDIETEPTSNRGRPMGGWMTMSSRG